MAVTLPSVYQDGTATVTSGGTVVTGQSTLWINAVLPGDFFGVHTGDPIRILSVDSNTQLTLANPYPGASQTEAHYEIMLQSDNGRMQETSRQLLETLSSGNNYAFSQLNGLPDTLPMFTGPGAMTLVTKAELVSGVRYDVQVDTLADRATYDGEAIGFTVLVSDVGDGRSAIYSKASLATGDWTDPAYLTGPVGPTPVFTANAKTLAAGAAATVGVTPITGGYNLAVGVPAGHSSGYPYTWSTTTTDANPGNGFIRANNASLASATFLFVSKTSAAGSALATYLLGLASSTNPTTKGDLTLQRISDGAIARFSVTAVTDATTYVKVAVTDHSGVTALTNNGAINLDFSRAGDKGTDGTGTGDVAGPNGGVTDNRLVSFNGTTGKLIKTATGAVPAMHALTTSANTFPYFTGATTAALADLTPFARTILDDATGAAMYATMGATQQLTSPGYTKLPNGIIIQWGRNYNATGSDFAIPLPIAFTTSVLVKLAVAEIAYTPTITRVVTIDNADTLNNITVRTRDVVNGGSVVSPGSATAAWIAIGI